MRCDSGHVSAAGGEEAAGEAVGAGGVFLFRYGGADYRGDVGGGGGVGALAVAAADALLQGETAYAFCRPPGHHAGRDYCGGFCYLNNVAIAAEHLLLHGKKPRGDSGY